MKKLHLIILLAMIAGTALDAQTAKEIIAKSEAQMNGESSYSEMKMTIIRPKWTREMTMKSWAIGTDYSLILVTGPARDKGIGFLKRKKEIWNWQPKIDRVIKMPPSMMMQSWMGSDFSNDDLVQQSSPVNDFTHEMKGEESIDGRTCWKIKLVPKPNVAVVWGSIVTWVDKKDYLQLKTEFYDDEGELVNTMVGKDIRQLGGRTVPARLEVIPSDKPGEKTIIEQLALDFNLKQTEDFFSIQNMKKLQ
ncbi:MAG: outer membrane lipoprotein-sorting protein [Saprospiraceae bacterium]|nr:outer membrane lipoprotein-sorting protein [Saprospiraceae bacterium]